MSHPTHNVLWCVAEKADVTALASKADTSELARKADAAALQIVSNDLQSQLSSTRTAGDTANRALQDSVQALQQKLDTLTTATEAGAQSLERLEAQSNKNLAEMGQQLAVLNGAYSTAQQHNKELSAARVGDEAFQTKCLERLQELDAALARKADLTQLNRMLEADEFHNRFVL